LAYNWTSLHYAASNGFLNVVDLLIKNHAEIKIKNSDGDTPFDLAKRKGHVNVLEYIKKEEEDRKQKGEFERIGKWQSIKPPDFESNIFDAVAKGKLKSIVFHLANGAYVNEKYLYNSFNGEEMKNSTLMHFASRYGHLNIIEYLEIKHADINYRDNTVVNPFLIQHLFIGHQKMVFLK